MFMTKSVFESFSFSLKVKWSDFFRHHCENWQHFLRFCQGSHGVESLKSKDDVVSRCLRRPSSSEKFQVSFKKFFKIEVSNRFPDSILKPTIFSLTFVTFGSGYKHLVLRVAWGAGWFNDVFTGFIFKFSEFLPPPRFRELFLKNKIKD